MQQKPETMELSLLLPVIEEVLSRGGEFELHPRGESMLPAIREGRDTVMLSRAVPPYARGDLLLYRRKNGVLVLHRVVKVERDGTLTMRGDNQLTCERGIPSEQVIATVKRYFRNGHEVRTDSMRARFYRFRRTVGYPFRRIAHAIGWRLKRIFQGERNG